MPATDPLREAERLMVVCNSCRYCEGLCAVFPAMEMRNNFADGDLNYLANLCHSCGACYVDCQFAPPHEFNVNVPETLARVRAQSYSAYVWPRALSGVFARNGLIIALLMATSITAFILGFMVTPGEGSLFPAPKGPGSFYALMPHNTMVVLFGMAFAYAVLAIAMSIRAFWKDTNAAVPLSVDLRAILQAVRDAGKLRYLDGAGAGCYTTDDGAPKDRRRLYHHMTFYGFLLCLASTSVATLYHYLLGREAPYPYYDLPVLLGIAGGIGLTLGPIGLFLEKRKRDPALVGSEQSGMDAAFLVMLSATSFTGLALVFLRETAAMPFLLAIHLSVVFSLFVAMPYSKFVHGIYRFVALVRYAAERNHYSL